MKIHQTSLLWRLVILLGCIITLFWLLTESIYFHSRYQSEKSTIKNELIAEINAAVGRESNHYLQAQRRVKTMLDLWRSMPEITDVNMRSQQIIFVPFPETQTNTAQLNKAIQLIHIFGVSSETEDEAIYLLIPDQGVIFYKSRTSAEQDLQRRARALQAIYTTLTTPGFHWGTPVKHANNKLYAPLSIYDKSSGILIGMDVEVWRLSVLNHELQSDISFAMLDKDHQYLPLATIEKAIPIREFPFNTIKLCHSSQEVEIGPWYYACAPFNGPSWWMIARYPKIHVTLKALEKQLWTLPPIMLGLLVLLMMVYWMMKRQFGEPLNDLTKVIERHSLLDWAAPLPLERQDELGRIAKSHKRLLSVLKAYYHTLESQVQERTRMLQEMNIRKSEHITSISHEIRTPMNSISGALDLLLHSRLNQDQRELVETARTSSEYLLSLINNLLDYSHIETGQLELPYESVELLPLLDKVMTTVHLRAEEKGLALSCLVDSAVPQEMLLSRMRVKQILINLLGNAIKFTHHGYVQLRVECRHSLLAFCVEDSGEGIAENQQQKIFHPFAQVSEHSGGNGLGLTISTVLSQAMGGKIQLSSQLGKGSCFTLELPIKQAGNRLKIFTGNIQAPSALHPQLRLWGITPLTGENAALSSPALIFLPGRLWRLLATLLQDRHFEAQITKPVAVSPWSLKILVVDDNAFNRDIIEKTLRNLGHKVDTAVSGTAALKYGQQRVYDMVLMDLRMPEMDGFTTARNWRDPDWEILDEETPIIALTADALKTEHERAKAYGMEGFLTKPIDMNKLLKAIEKVVMLQLVRGRELTPNAMLNRPLLDVSQDDALRDKISDTFRNFILQVELAWKNKQPEPLQDILHAIKGSAGLCNMNALYHCAEQLEGDVCDGLWPSRSRIEALISLLNAEITPRLTDSTESEGEDIS